MNIQSLDNITAKLAGMSIAKQFRVRWTALDGSKHEWPFRAVSVQGAANRVETFMSPGDRDVVLCDNYGEPICTIK